MSTPNFLRGTLFYIVPTGIGSIRAKLFMGKIQKHGGSVSTQISPYVTHILVDDKMDWSRLMRITKFGPSNSPPNCHIVKSMWLSLCLKDQRKWPEGEFLLIKTPVPMDASAVAVLASTDSTRNNINR